METEEKELLNKKKNHKNILIYRILSCDLLFFYTISYIFLVNIKGLTTTEVILADSFYPLFKIAFQIPLTILIQEFGKKNSLIVANSMLIIYFILFLGVNSLILLIGANVLCAFAFTIKNLAESNYLYESFNGDKNQKDKFSKYEGLSNAGYYFLDAITSFITGFTYAINPYLPIIFSLLFTVLALMFLINTKDTKVKYAEKVTFKSQITDFVTSFKYIISSNRLKALILFNALFGSLISVMINLRRSIFEDVNISSTYLGIIFALMGIISSYSATQNLKIHNKYHNKSLLLLGIFLTLSIIITGLITVIDVPMFLMYFILLTSVSIVYIVRGPYYPLIKKYLNNFTDDNIRLKIYTANSIIEFFAASLVSFFASFLLGYFSNEYATLIIGIVSFILMLVLLIYMSSRVGLDPNNYSKEEIKYDTNPENLEIEE